MYSVHARLRYGYGGQPAAQAGGMAEWLKAHDSKSCRPPKGLVGSNPTPSARMFWSKATHKVGGCWWFWTDPLTPWGQRVAVTFSPPSAFKAVTVMVYP